MSANAIISKQCPSDITYLVPGRIAMNNTPKFSDSPPAEEEIVVDAMLANGITVATYINLVMRLTLLEPKGCEFVPTNEHKRPNDIIWNFPVTGNTRIMDATVITGLPEKLNRGNSKSFRFAIKGRAGREIKLQVLIKAQPVSVEVDSCLWTIEGLDLTTANLGVPLDELPL